MDINIKAIHFDINEKLTAFINKKIERIARRFPAVASAEVSLKVVKPETALNKQAIVSLRGPQLPSAGLVADKTADSFEEAVDTALDALEKQLDRVKEKLQ